MSNQHIKTRKITLLLDEATIDQLRKYSEDKIGAVNLSAAIRMIARELAKNETNTRNNKQ